MNTAANIQQAVPFLLVHDLAASLRFYVDGLGGIITQQWVDHGTLRWCWLSLGDAALMLQQHGTPPDASATPGTGVTLYYICRDALAIYRSALAAGLSPQRPFVGNGMWVVNLRDPDGYALAFESPTDAPEESEYTG